MIKIPRDTIKIVYKKMDNQFIINREGRAYEGDSLTYERYMSSGEPLDEWALEELESQAVEGWIEIIKIETKGGAVYDS